MSNTKNIWGTTVGQSSISETVALYIAFTAEAAAGTVDTDVTSDLFQGFENGPSMADSDWASI